MLHELVVRDLGVIRELSLVLGPGMTALTGETGAGKTLLVEAIGLLVGGRAEASMVRPGAREAAVEGRLLLGGASEEETVVRRVVPASGRSRAYLNGSLATASELAAVVGGAVDLHGQHAHQSLLSPTTQREALDRFGEISDQELRDREAEIAELDRRLEDLGGDERERERELDLLRHQVDEIVAADPRPGEEEALREEEARLADAAAHREAGLGAAALLLDDEGALDRCREAATLLGSRAPFDELRGRLGAAVVELEELAQEMRGLAEVLEEDPLRLEQVQERRRLLGDLRRKYGETTEEVLAFATRAAARAEELSTAAERADTLCAQRDELVERRDAAAVRIGAARRAAGPRLAAAVGARLGDLALQGAVLEVQVEGEAGHSVEVLFAAQPDAPPAPLRRIASGGELARVMLALRLVLTAGPPTLVFDEVDAGIGGSAAVAVGRALADVSKSHQVLVVTHLPQVAAYADAQVAVTKETTEGRTRVSARALDEAGRVDELSRMLSGAEGGEAARGNAQELLARAAAARPRAGGR